MPEAPNVEPGQKEGAPGSGPRGAAVHRQPDGWDRRIVVRGAGWDCADVESDAILDGLRLLLADLDRQREEAPTAAAAAYLDERIGSCLRLLTFWRTGRAYDPDASRAEWRRDLRARRASLATADRPRGEVRFRIRARRRSPEQPPAARWNEDGEPIGLLDASNPEP